MKNYIQHDPWKIIERDWNPENNMISESIFSIGNGYMGVRGNFAEGYDEKTLVGSYLSGIYYPDKTKVGWWKNGYPAYFAKIPNACNWIGFNLSIDDQPVQMDLVTVDQFECILDMKTGVLYRTCTLTIPNKGQLELRSTRFCSMQKKELAGQEISIKSISISGSIRIESYLDFNVVNNSTNYGENFWVRLGEGIEDSFAWVQSQTRKTAFDAFYSMACEFQLNNRSLAKNPQESSSRVSYDAAETIQPGDVVRVRKIVCALQSMYVSKDKQLEAAHNFHELYAPASWDTHLEQHCAAWAAKWQESDIEIEGDDSAQQGIRYNIFQLHQTYTGEDPRLNIGPKGMTGEKYGGSTYWDTEAYCLPFFLSTAHPSVARNLLIYRHNQLGKAIENASLLGFSGGAALYPMVTMNGEECHNEWEITFEEIHRNGAIAYAIYNYVKYTGDTSYIQEYGLEVLIGIARFWAQRFQYSEAKQAYVMLGVTGPNEYENNVNNNWYTNYIARWCLEYTASMIDATKTSDGSRWQDISALVSWNEAEMERWNKIISNVYFPMDDTRGVFLQQDGFLDKEIRPAASIPSDQIPIHQSWSWDRILRSCFIKQADVLQGLYFFEDHFTIDEIKRNFDFYEPLTVHESSLSPCIHAIQACLLDKDEKAYEMYLRTARLDLDDYNNDTEDGLHITSMAGTWLAVVQGFGGMRIKNNQLYFRPRIPKKWKSIKFHIRFRANLLLVEVTTDTTIITNIEGPEIQLTIEQQHVTIPSTKEIIINHEK